MSNDAGNIYDETRVCAFIGTRFAVGDRDKMSIRMGTLEVSCTVKSSLV